tara:strand:+ start:270 stop:458 length:189 start_codon:yes stop_codon:yes gene_type:complete
MKDSKRRSFSKTVSWRTVAVINSYVVLAMAFTNSPLWNAIVMNIFGAILYYVHERVWNKIEE